MNRTNRSMFLPGLALAGGAAAFVLRLLQNRTGFEADTGLPVPGNPWAIALMAALVLLAAAVWFLSRWVPDELSAPPSSFEAAFASPAALPLTILIAGLFLTALSGAADLAAGLGIALPGPDAAYEAEVFLPAQRDPAALLCGVLSVLIAAGGLAAAVSCRRSGKHEAAGTAPREFNPNLLLVAPICLVVRLVVTYRNLSVDPSLSAYYVEILALVCTTLAVYRLSSFGFQCGRTRRFFQYAAAAVILCMASMADGNSVSGVLFYAGSALTLWGWMLQRLSAPGSIQA